MSKILPKLQHIDIEQKVLGAVILQRRLVSELIDLVSEEDFTTPLHKEIFRSIKRLMHEGMAVDIHSIIAIMGIDKATYIADLTSSPAHTAAFRTHCTILNDLSVKRNCISLCNEVTTRCFDKNTSSGKIASDLSKRFFQLTEGKTSKPALPIVDALNEVLKDIQSRTPNRTRGIPTGFVELDNILSGLQKSDLLIVGARPAMGKTAFALNLALQAAKTHRVAFFSLEMSIQQLVERLLITTSGLYAHHVGSGQINGDNRRKLDNAERKLRNLPIVVDDRPALNISTLTARSKTLHQQAHLGLIIVDYLQLLKGEGQNREQEIASISRGLKALAKELDIPVIALSQLNRSLENRDDKRPQMNDLRESGAIEQDADIISFLYRDEVYNKNPGNPLKGIAEIIIAKHRNGPTGTIKLRFEAARFTFRDFCY